MSNISILPDLLVNKIAAGEVIERPASVVRELIDNSIDAGASEIDVEILHAGKKLIRVSDNGLGMDRDDAVLCLERHATSKIRSEDDLFDISTLGFRGEALPAIASVSKITLATSAENAGAGTKIEVGVNRKKEISDAPPSRGTTVEIRDIFYNTPARRKFLKSDPTELSHIIETVVQKALAYPERSFSLVHNSSEVLKVPSALTLRERFTQLYGEEMAGEFLDVGKDGRGMKVYGFVSKADFTRAGKSHQHIFVNLRPVKNPTVNHAVYKAYADMIPGDRHPAYFIFLDIERGRVDVNVHPAKREVRFEVPDEVHRMVEAAVYEALNPGVHREVYPLGQTAVRGNAQKYQYGPADNAFVREGLQGAFPASQSDFFTAGITPDIREFFHIGESFFATVTAEGLLVFDQHAAHERILFERFLGNVSIEAIPLFLPVRVELPVKEYQVVIRYKSLLQRLGLDVDDFGDNNVIVRALPKELTKADMKGILMDVAAGIVEEETSGIRNSIDEQSLLKNIAARLACHRSVRGSEALSNAELARMLTDLDKTSDPDRCPHGRPTKIILSLDELKKMFKRK